MKFSFDDLINHELFIPIAVGVAGLIILILVLAIIVNVLKNKKKAAKKASKAKKDKESIDYGVEDQEDITISDKSLSDQDDLLISEEPLSNDDSEYDFFKDLEKNSNDDKKDLSEEKFDDETLFNESFEEDLNDENLEDEEFSNEEIEEEYEKESFDDEDDLMEEEISKYMKELQKEKGHSYEKEEQFEEFEKENIEELEEIEDSNIFVESSSGDEDDFDAILNKELDLRHEDSFVNVESTLPLKQEVVVEKTIVKETYDEEQMIELKKEIISEISDQLNKRFNNLESLLNQVSSKETTSQSNIDNKILEEILSKLNKEDSLKVSSQPIAKTVENSLDNTLVKIYNLLETSFSKANQNTTSQVIVEQKEVAKKAPIKTISSVEKIKNEILNRKNGVGPQSEDYIIQSHSEGGWQIKKFNSKRALKRFSLKTDAITYGKFMATNNNINLYEYKKDKSYKKI